MLVILIMVPFVELVTYTSRLFQTDVFNTEAHPFVAPPAKSSYGSGNLITPTNSFAPTTVENGPLPEVSPNRFLPTPLSELLRGL